MPDVGPLSTYYWRTISTMDFEIGWTMGLTHVISALGLITSIALIFLALLIIRARPKAAENRFMCVLLLAESWRVLAQWYNLFPLGPEFIPIIQYYRVGWYFCGILCIMLYISTISFYPTKRTRFMSKDAIKNNLWWALPVISAILLGMMISGNGGLQNTIGGTMHVDCSQPMVFDSDGNSPATLTYSVGMPETTGVCNQDLSPYVYFVPEAGSGLSTLLLLTPILSATIAMFMMRSAWKLSKEEGREDDANEARSLFIGFAGKVTIKGMAVISIIATTVMFGRFNLADMTTIEDIDQLVIYFYCLYAFLFSILLTGMFEGIMFTYAILKNDILGIDEKLRKAFSTTIFAGIGGIILIAATETMESFIPGGGLVGGLIIGAPLIVLRKPIFSVINNFSTMLMPEAFTKSELSYIEAYEIAMEDRIITEEERKFLKLQAKTLGLDQERIDYIESWYNSNLENEEE
ncbi:MAG: hypothetical protein CMA29_01000 [Euryarchaeota archaeon]|jgi:hypothetical protein|nr:hypothetical protein [Euryarchaeota archaeon]